MPPQAIDDLFALALIAIDEMALGKDDEPDLLVVSVSTTDYVGHNYGPDSLEQLDTLRRADASLRRFVRALDEKIGRRRFNVLVASDHGAPPLPGAMLANPATARVPGGIVTFTSIAEAADAAAKKALPADKKKRVLGFSSPQLFFDLTELSPADTRKLLDAVIVAVEAVPGIANVYDMTVKGPDEDALSPLMWASAPPGRHAPLFV